MADAKLVSFYGLHIIFVLAIFHLELILFPLIQNIYITIV